MEWLSHLFPLQELFGPGKVVWSRRGKNKRAGVGLDFEKTDLLRACMWSSQAAGKGPQNARVSVVGWQLSSLHHLSFLRAAFCQVRNGGWRLQDICPLATSQPCSTAQLSSGQEYLPCTLQGLLVGLAPSAPVRFSAPSALINRPEGVRAGFPLWG
jgi:hypothetical protein